jgi:hypothetical protein
MAGGWSAPASRPHLLQLTSVVGLLIVGAVSGGTEPGEWGSGEDNLHRDLEMRRKAQRQTGSSPARRAGG